jgi:membrane-bound serine protease (ClpP class)
VIKIFADFIKSSALVNKTRQRILLIYLLSFMLLAFGRHGLLSETAESTTGSILVISVKGTINPASSDYIKKNINDAPKENVGLVVIELDTPGGLLSSTKEIVQSILNAPVPVVIFVTPAGASATSAGVFITMSGHIAAMAPGSSIGAAHPVSGSGKDIKDEGGSNMEKKVENYASAFIEGIAKKTGRNSHWAIDAVRKSVSITAEDALKLNVIDLLAGSLPELLKKIDGRTVKVKESQVRIKTTGLPLKRKEMTMVQKFLDILSTPNIALLLLSLGSLGIIAELYHPGTYFPGVVGGICFILGLISLQILPINYGGLALIGLSIILFVAEIFVPSFGILGVGGILSFIFGALFLFDTPESDLSVSLGIVLAIAASFGAFMIVAGTLISKVIFQKPHSGPESLIGVTGRVVQEIKPGIMGKVFFHGEYWNAYSDQEISKDAKVKIIARENLSLKVSPQEDKP